MDTVIRYVVTKVDKNGMRTLAMAAQGRNTYASAEEAQTWLDAMRNSPHNSAQTLQSVYGDVTKMEVRPCECWPVHFDPKGVYFDV